MASKGSLPISSKIALPYRLFFLYIEPVMALSGAYLLYSDPAMFVNRCTPTIFFEKAISPLAQLLLTQIISLYIMHALIESTVLRATKEIGVWKCVMLAILAADIGHLWALYVAEPAEFLNIGGWRSDDWVNYGLLSFGLLMRVSFLLGIGNSK